jgi:hypothetical protein
MTTLFKSPVVEQALNMTISGNIVIIFVFEQESFGWKDGEQVANIDAMPQEERESVVAALKANGGKFVAMYCYTKVFICR